MKKTFSLLAAFSILAALQAAQADNTKQVPGSSGSSASTSLTPVPATTPSSTRKHKRSKRAAKLVVAPTTTPSPLALLKQKPVVTPTPVPETPNKSALGSTKIYNQINMPGDLRKAIFLALQTLSPISSKHSRSVFLAMEKVSSNKDNEIKKNSYVRLNIDNIEFGGPRNAWILLVGTVYEQSGFDCKVGDPIELAVDFKDIKIDYDGSKIGQIQKGNDIAGQVYEILTTRPAYQWVLLAQDQVVDSKHLDDTPVFIAKAKDGYMFLDFLNSTREYSR
jgi:hypothetical protein